MSSPQFTWEKGEKNRPFELHRPCSCGCDERDGNNGVGYLTGSDKDGNGVTVWIETEEVFQSVRKVI